MSAAFHITHEDGRKEIVREIHQAIAILIQMYENEEQGEVRWSS